MIYPLAWYITWTTYGTWLHGDPRGSYFDSRPVPPDLIREEAMRKQMNGEPVYLTDAQRQLVDATLVSVCLAEGWILHARNVRTNHVHIVVSASKDGKQVRSRLKAKASAALSDAAGLPMTDNTNGRRRWWTEKGNIVPVEIERALEEVVIYV